MTMKNPLRGVLRGILVRGLITAFSAVIPVTGLAANGEGEDSKPLEITAFHYRVESNAEFQDLADIYAAENPGVNIIFDTVAENYIQAMQGKIAADDVPTIFAAEGPVQIELFREYLEDLSDQPWIDLAFDDVVDGITLDGKVYGLPWQISGYGLIYNKRILEEAGIDIEKYRNGLTMDSLREIATVLDGRKAELGIEAVFVLAPKAAWTINHLVNTPLALEFGDVQEAYGASKVDFTYSREFKDFIDLQLQYAYKKDLINNVGYSEQVEQIFALERVPLMHQGMWVYQAVRSINEELSDNMGFFPLPFGENTDSIAVGVPGYWVVNTEADPREKEAAKDFLNYMYTSDAGKEAVVTKINFVPPLKGYENFVLPNPLSRDILSYSDAGKTIPWVFQGVPPRWGAAGIQKYLAGLIDWDELTSEVREEWEQARR